MDNSYASSYCVCGIANLKEVTDLCSAGPVSAVFNIRRSRCVLIPFVVRNFLFISCNSSFLVIHSRKQQKEHCHHLGRGESTNKAKCHRSALKLCSWPNNDRVWISRRCHVWPSQSSSPLWKFSGGMVQRSWMSISDQEG